MNLGFNLLSYGKALPKHKISDVDIDLQQGFNPGTTFKLGGVKHRYFASLQEQQSSLAAAALTNALTSKHLKLADLDLIISASAVPEQALPNNAASIARELGVKHISTMDVNVSCLSFMGALKTAVALVNVGIHKRVAIVSSDLPSRGINFKNPEASLIFGDGAVAFIIERGQNSKLVDIEMQTHPEGFNHCQVKAGGTLKNIKTGINESDFLFEMDGKAVFKLASKIMPQMIEKFLIKNGLQLSDIDAIVPHQASNLAMQHMSKRLGFDFNKIIDIYSEHGNQVAASQPSALYEGIISNKIRPGDTVLLIGTAAGFTAGLAILKI